MRLLWQQTPSNNNEASLYEEIHRLVNHSKLNFPKSSLSFRLVDAEFNSIYGRRVIWTRPVIDRSQGVARYERIFSRGSSPHERKRKRRRQGTGRLGRRHMLHTAPFILSTFLTPAERFRSATVKQPK